MNSLQGMCNVFSHSLGFFQMLSDNKAFYCIYLAENSEKAQKLIEKSITMQSLIIPRQIAFIWFMRAGVLLNTEKIDEAIGDLKLAFSLDHDVLKWIEIFGYDEKLNQIKSWKSWQKMILRYS